MPDHTPGCDSGELRLLSALDIAAAFQLSAEAGWNQTVVDWKMLLEIARESCWAIEIGGQVAATTTLVCYERRLAWLGMVLTKTEYRKRGLAGRLLATALAYADQMGIKTVKLDATEQGKPLYEKFGFHPEQEVERWLHPGKNVPQFPVARRAANGVWRDVDLTAFGANRTELLSKLSQRNPAIEHSQSYLFMRPGRITAHLGPCVSEDARTARRLIEECVQDTECGWSWDLFPRNQEAVALARDLGFVPQRHLLRMYRGQESQQKQNVIYAAAGFELG